MPKSRAILLFVWNHAPYVIARNFLKYAIVPYSCMTLANISFSASLDVDISIPTLLPDLLIIVSISCKKTLFIILRIKFYSVTLAIIALTTIHIRKANPPVNARISGRKCSGRMSVIVWELSRLNLI